MSPDHLKEMDKEKEDDEVEIVPVVLVAHGWHVSSKGFKTRLAHVDGSRVDTRAEEEARIWESNLNEKDMTSWKVTWVTPEDFGL